jgi:hypothetical protein
MIEQQYSLYIKKCSVVFWDMFYTYMTTEYYKD